MMKHSPSIIKNKYFFKGGKKEKVKLGKGKLYPLRIFQYMKIVNYLTVFLS